MNSEKDIIELYSKHGIDGILCAMDIGDSALALVVELEKENTALKQQAALDAPVVAAAEAYQMFDQAHRRGFLGEDMLFDTRFMLMRGRDEAMKALIEASHTRREAMAK